MSTWWERGVIYQIYPRSFMDLSGDGIGDLRGIRSRLDYVQGLGVDAIWISPIFPSPMADFGYDVSDYTAIHPLFGTMADFDVLLAESHARGLKVILDFVPNHTSEEHPWFVESRRSRDNPRRDWYLWRDPAPDGGPPNNWLSQFGGSGWELDRETGQYYYHAFLKQQPDLNWRNPKVVAAMHDVLRFWLRRGVDGFRVDVLWHLIKDDRFRDNPPNPSFKPGDPPAHAQIPVYSTDRPEIMDIVAGLRRVLDEFDERVLIGEIYLPIERLVAYYGANLQGAHLPFNFQLIQAAWNARDLAKLVAEYEGAIPPGGWPNWVLGNHDQRRIATRVGTAQARVAGMLLLSLRGTPTMYYGDEIGMHDVHIPPQRVQDPFEKNCPGMGLGRDPCRTPMQWTAGPNAGFSGASPWLPLADDYALNTVEGETRDPLSILSFYRRLLELRRSEAALSIGSFLSVSAHGDLLAFQRARGTDRFLIALNLGKESTHFAFPEGTPRAGWIALSTNLDRDREQANGSVHLRPHEGVIVSFRPRAAAR